MKKVLIVSPHFPPVNAADMHRVRQSLPYFKRFGWEPTVLYVDPEYVELAKDQLLLKSLPHDIEMIAVNAYATNYTRKVGLGNLGIRAFRQLYKAGSKLLGKQKFDLVYFSTTVFASMPLGRLWKKKFKVPFVVDMQDPWRNDYYLTVPKSERPPKFWFAYRLNKYMEAFTIPKVDGIIAVSQPYIDELKKRYPIISKVPERTLTFGAHPLDLEIASKIKENDMSYKLDKSKINIIYAGVIPNNMLFSIGAILKALRKGIDNNPEFEQIRFHFIGTNYAIGSSAKNALNELIDKYELNDYVNEFAMRVPYFEALNLVRKSNLAILPGTCDRDYTASKLFPYIMSGIPMIAVFHEKSSVLTILDELNYGKGISFSSDTEIDQISKSIFKKMDYILKNGQSNCGFNTKRFEKYKSEYLCEQQAAFFDKILRIQTKNKKKTKNI